MKKFALALTLVLAPVLSHALEVTMKLSAIGGATPQIQGITNLPDGSPVSVMLSMPGVFMGQDQAIVKNGRFSTANFSDRGQAIPGGMMFVQVTTPLAAFFPSEAKRAIGEEGQLMTGPLVTSLPSLPGYSIRASGSFQIRHPEDPSARKLIDILELRGR